MMRTQREIAVVRKKKERTIPSNILLSLSSRRKKKGGKEWERKTNIIKRKFARGYSEEKRRGGFGA